MEAESERCHAAGLERGGRGPSAKECVGLLFSELGKANEFSPRAARRAVVTLTP